MMANTVQTLATLDDYSARQAQPETAPRAVARSLRPIASWGAAALATAGLLLVLGWVVQDHVRQAQARHEANAARTAALSRCAVLAHRDMREDCRRVAMADPLQAQH